MAPSSHANARDRRDPDRLGRYRIVRRIAEGGMAELYCAHASAASDGQPGFEREVAIKRILPHLARGPEFVRMFLNEARLAATFRHPNVVSVFEVGVDEDEHFIVMELLDGADVSRLLRATSGSPLPLEHALQIALGAAAALHYAHEQRDAAGAPLEIVHRDVSPQNIFVTRDGAVKVLDFGIAKAAGQLAQTGQSTLKGKTRYMSPEQCAGEPVDRRSDLFALCIVIWEMSTGRNLFGAEGDYKVMKAITETDAPRPSTLVPGYPLELEQIVMKGLARRPEARYPTAEELQLALEGFLRSAGILPSTVRLGQYVRAIVPPARPSALPIAAGAAPVAAPIGVEVTSPTLDGPRGGHTRPIRRGTSLATPVESGDEGHPTPPGLALADDGLSLVGRPRWRLLGPVLLGLLATSLAAGAVRWIAGGPSAASPAAPPPEASGAGSLHAPQLPVPPPQANAPVVSTAAIPAQLPSRSTVPPRSRASHATPDPKKAHTRQIKDRQKVQPEWDEFSPRLPPRGRPPPCPEWST